MYNTLGSGVFNVTHGRRLADQLRTRQTCVQRVADVYTTRVRELIPHEQTRVPYAVFDLACHGQRRRYVIPSTQRRPGSARVSSLTAIRSVVTVCTMVLGDNNNSRRCSPILRTAKSPNGNAHPRTSDYSATRRNRYARESVRRRVGCIHALVIRRAFIVFSYVYTTLCVLCLYVYGVFLEYSKNGCHGFPKYSRRTVDASE